MSIIIVPKDFPTIQAAVIATQPGDLIFVKKGTYHESVDVLEKSSISIIAEKGAVLDGENQLPYGFNTSGSFIEIKGFKIKNYLSYGVIVRALGSYIINNTIEKIGLDGILIEQQIIGFPLNIFKNEINNVKGNGINIGRTNTTVNIIRNVINKIGNNGINAVQFENGMIFDNDIHDVENEGIFIGNSSISSIFKDSISHAKSNGISITSFFGLVANNKTDFNRGNGIVLNGVFEGFNFIEENHSPNNKEDGIQVNQDNNFIIRNIAKDNKDDGIDLNSIHNEVVENFACDNEEDNDIENNGLKNSFSRNKVCNDSLDHHHHHHNESSS